MREATSKSPATPTEELTTKRNVSSAPWRILPCKNALTKHIRIEKVVIKMPDRAAHGIGHEPYVVIRYRLQYLPVDHVSKYVGLAVDVLVGVMRLERIGVLAVGAARSGTTRKQHYAE